jgi:HAD superfamily hydrolase (TIGR01549 family)
MNLNKLKTLIKKSPVISFDVFDTLIIRSYANPINVFQHIEEMNNTKGFTDMRCLAEQNARNFYNKSQVNFDEIYGVMSKDFAFLKDKEAELEKNTLYANPEIQKIYEYAKGLGKTIVLITDMYLPIELMTEILNKNGYRGFDKLYISGWIRKAKYTHDLYEHVLDELKISPYDILHIGDNFYADCQCAKECGLKTFLYKKPLEQFFEKFPKIKSFYKLNENNLSIGITIGLLLKKWMTCRDKLKKYWYYFGYFWGGAICYGLAKFVNNEVISEKIKRIIFVERDGYTIQKIVDLINTDKEIKTDYIVASRVLNLLINLDYKQELTWTTKAISIVKLYKGISPNFKKRCPKDINDTETAKRVIEENLDIIKPLQQQIRDNYKHYLEKYEITDNKIAL